jgi:hypothetical protein
MKKIDFCVGFRRLIEAVTRAYCSGPSASDLFKKMTECKETKDTIEALLDAEKKFDAIDNE